MMKTISHQQIWLGLLDFREAFHQAPEQAIADLEGLLTNETACRCRIAFLQALITDSSPLSNREEPDLAEVINLACNVGLMRAFHEGLLREEYIDLLHRLTCRPEPLWQTHLRLMALGHVDSQLPGQETAIDDATTRDQEKDKNAGG